jgi:hypothetical protein
MVPQGLHHGTACPDQEALVRPTYFWKRWLYTLPTIRNVELGGLRAPSSYQQWQRIREVVSKRFGLLWSQSPISDPSLP